MTGRTSLTLLILAGLAAGAFYGQYVLYDPLSPLGEQHWTRTVGEFVLVRPLMLLLVPLALLSLVVSVASIANPAKLGLVGAATVTFFLASMLLAVSLGVFLAERFEPGRMPVEIGAALRAAAEGQFEAAAPIADDIRRAQQNDQANPGAAWINIVHQAVPANLLEEMARGRLLGLTLFALLLGLGLAAAGEPGAAAAGFLRGLHTALLHAARWLAWLAPIGLFLLLAYAVGRLGLESLSGALAKYVSVVAGGLAIHALIILPIILLLLTRRNPWGYMWRVRKALLIGFGTASSAATLPVTIESALHEGRCSARAAGFVIPLGAALHRGGTALFEAVAAIFLFQLYGIDLNFNDLVVVVITATLAAVGASGIPAAGLVTLVIVIEGVNTGLAGRGEPQLPLHAIGIIVALDRALDMCRTLVNVWSDLVAARIITELAPDAENAQTHKRPNAQTKSAITEQG